MSRFLCVATLLAAVGLAWPQAVRAQTGPTPRQLQTEIDNGQAGAALGALRPVLQAHPESGAAWYLTAEAEDATGNEAAARGALAKADQYAPGLPFAQPDKVAALRAHLGGGGAPASRGFSPVLAVLGVFAVLFILIRMLLRSRRRMPAAYPNAYPPVPPQGPYPYQGGGGTPFGGGGLGGSLMSGLAAGAGFAAGERIIDDMTGDRSGNGFGGQDASADQPPPDRDDGLSGSPGWDDSGGDNFDQNNNW